MRQRRIFLRTGIAEVARSMDSTASHATGGPSSAPKPKSGAVKGWVYIISNRSMLGLVKIGFSTKDPILRAAELSQAGTPHPHIVEYDVLVLGTRAVRSEEH